MNTQYVIRNNPLMLAAFLLGLTGSVAHCTGMCSGVAILLARQGVARGWRLLLAHLGRISSYGLLGAGAGSLGYAVAQMVGHEQHHTEQVVIPGLRQWQGGMALVTAVIALYFSLSLLGYVPSPELLFTRLTRLWGRTMRQMEQQPGSFKEPGCLRPYMLGLLWGLLPCGLVLTALLAAAVTGSPWQGGLTMLLFGLGTWPMPITIGVMGRLQGVNVRSETAVSLRYAAALIVFLFGAQMALRGLAAWGWVNHLQWGEVVIW